MQKIYAKKRKDEMHTLHFISVKKQTIKKQNIG